MAGGVRAAITRDCDAQPCSYVLRENYSISGEQCQKRAAVNRASRAKPALI